MRATTAYLLTSSPQSSLVPAGGKERWHRATQVRHSSHSLLLPSSRSLGGSPSPTPGQRLSQGRQKTAGISPPLPGVLVPDPACQTFPFPVVWPGRCHHPPAHTLFVLIALWRAKVRASGSPVNQIAPPCDAKSGAGLPRRESCQTRDQGKKKVVGEEGLGQHRGWMMGGWPLLVRAVWPALSRASAAPSPSIVLSVAY